MSVDQRTGFLGLVTNASSQQTPAGALIEANNVVIRRSGAAEPRDGLLPATGMDGTELWGFSYGTRDIIARGPVPLPDLFSEWRTTTGTVLANGPQPLRVDIFTKAELRGNLYVAARDGVKRLLSSATSFERAGLPLESAIIQTTLIAGAWLPNNNQVAYRVVGYSLDASGLVRRSAPTGATIVVNASGGAQAVRLTIASTGASYAQVELYRSRVFPTTVQVDDEMQLVGVFDLPSPTFTISVDDQIAQADRGATLYTSPSRGGILEQNDPPPACACVAAFKSSLFFGNVRGPQRISVSYRYNPAATGVTGIGMRTYGGTLGGGNTTYTGMANTDGIEVGMLVGRTDTNFLARITAVAATSVTFTPALPGGPAATLRFYDTIELDGHFFAVPSPPNATGGSYIPTILGGGPAGGAAAIGFVAYLVTPPEGGYTHTLVIESVSRDALPVHTIRASHGAEYASPLPNMIGLPMDMPQDVFPGGLFWSKPDEPEHVAPINFAFVGDQARAILGLVPTRDALFILKEDGVWRLTGVNATWRIDPYDPTLFCCLPNSIAPLQERAYFLSNKGVIAFSDGGSELISQPIDDLIHPLIDEVYQWFRDTGLYQIPHLNGFCAGVYERENEYTMLSREFEPAFVYNRNTSAWTRFHWGAADGTTTPDEESTLFATFTLSYQGRIVYALNAEQFGDQVPLSMWTRLSTDAVPFPLSSLPRFDRGVAATSGASPPGTLTLNVHAFRDDVFVRGSSMIRVPANTPAGTPFTPDPGVFPPSPGLGTLYRPLHCRVTPQAFTTPPPRPKRWRAFSATFERFTGPVALRYAYASSESPRATPEDWDEEDADTVKDGGRIIYPMGLAYAGLVPSAHARAWSMRGSVRWAMAQGYARLEGCFIEAEMMELGRQQRAV